MLRRPAVAARIGRNPAYPLAMTALATACLLTACASAASSQADPRASGTAKASSPASGHAKTSTTGLATCRASSLRVTVDAREAGGTAGSMYYPVNFTNSSGSACRLDGYPEASFVTAGSGSGKQIGAAAQQNPEFGKVTVRLAAGGSAHAWLQVSQAGNYPSSACKPVTAHWLRVYAPGATVASYVSQSFDACASASTKLLTVMPVRAGQGVRGVTP